MKRFVAILLGLGVSTGATLAQPAPAPAPASPTIVLRDRHGHGTPVRQGFTHTGGGNIDVAQPTPDTLVVTMTGVAVAGGHPCKDSVASIDFDLNQCLDIIAPERTKPVKVTLEARVIGLLRSHPTCCKKGCGTAEITAAHAALGLDCATGGEPVAVSLVPHSVAGGENLSVNDHAGPVESVLAPGRYTLHATFGLSAAHPRSVLPCKAASAEFAPDPALDPLWISYWEPFHGAIKKDFGFQLTLKVAADEGAPNGKR